MAWQVVLIFGLSFVAGFLIAAMLAGLTDVALVPGPRWRDPERWLGNLPWAEPAFPVPACAAPQPPALVSAYAASSGNYWSTHVARHTSETPSRSSALV